MRLPVLVLLLVAFPPSGSAQSVTVQLPVGFRVEIAPPQLRVEVPPPAPSHGHVWVAGYWSFSSGRYVWVPGSYVVAPQTGARWMPAQWVLRNGAWYFEPGRWEAGAAVISQPAPPPPYQRPPPPAPPPQYQQPPPPPPPYRQQPPPRRLSRDEAVQRAYQIASQHGLQVVSVREVEPGDGVWKVKLILDDGGKAKLEIDPFSGEAVKFKVDGGCHPNQYWDGERCRHKGRGHGARKHDDDD